MGRSRRKRMGRMAAMAAVVWAVVCAACSGEHEDGGEGMSPYAESRTVMVYIAAENSLYVNVGEDMAEMLSGMRQGGFRQGDKLVVFVDNMNKPRIYVLDSGTKAKSIAELVPVVQYEEEVNSASATVLGEFVDYVKENVPAESYGLVMWSHGSGWIPSTYSGDDSSSSKRRSFAVDNGANTSSSALINQGSQMNIADMARVLEERGGVDFILFDACFMQAVEVAYELRHATKHIVASPAEIPAPGANYRTMVPAMFKRDNVAEEMLQAYYSEYADRPEWGIVVSAVDTEGLPAFSAYMKAVVADLETDFLSAEYSSALNYMRYGVWRTDMPDMYDMQGVMREMLNDEAFSRWKKEVGKVVVCKHANSWYHAKSSRTDREELVRFDDGQCCGMSMFLPLGKYEGSVYGFNESWLRTDWARDVWLEGDWQE